MSQDTEFGQQVANKLAELPGVRAVALGGSRATGTNRPDSDWDFAIYYRDSFDPADLRAIGWPGQVSEVGGWGGGVFNGGAWLEVEGHKVDVHYRDLTELEHHIAEADAGRFHIERLLFHLAGVPSYLPIAELSVNKTLVGVLPRPDYPAALRKAAPPRWFEEAAITLAYARTAHAPAGHLTDCLGAIATAACQTGHAVLAARGQWVTNEKTLLTRAGLRALDDVLAGARPDRLIETMAAAAELLRTVHTDTED